MDGLPNEGVSHGQCPGPHQSHEGFPAVEAGGENSETLEKCGDLAGRDKRQG